MNQGIAFSRTLRSLEADDFRASKLGLFLGVLVIGAWTWWMFTPRVPRYETTIDVLVNAGSAIAYLPDSALAHVETGQSALLHFDDDTFQARVQAVAPGHATLIPSSTHWPPPAKGATVAGYVEIEIARVTPAAIALETLTRGHR